MEVRHIALRVTNPSSTSILVFLEDSVNVRDSLITLISIILNLLRRY